MCTCVFIPRQYIPKEQMVGPYGRMTVCLNTQGTARLFSKLATPFYIPLVEYERSNSYGSSPTLLGSSHPNRCTAASHC